MKVCFFLPTLDKYLDRVKMLGNLALFCDKFYLLTDSEIGMRNVNDEIKKQVHIIPLTKNGRKKPLLFMDIFKSFTKMRGELDIVHDTFGFLLPVFMSHPLYEDSFKRITTLYASNAIWALETRKIIKYRSFSYNLLRIKALFYDYMICKNSDAIIVLANGLEEPMKRLYRLKKQKIGVIPNCVDTDFFYKTKATKEELGFSNADFLLLYVGNIFRLKGIYDILNALPYVKSFNPKVKLVCIGSIHKYEENHLAKTIYNLGLSDHLVFIPYMDRHRLRDFYSSCDLLVFPSYVEGSPRIVKEAAACGLPAIGTDIPGIRVIDELGEFLTFVPINNPGILAKAICQVIESIDYYRDKARIGIERMEEKFSPPVIAEKTFNFYKQINNQ